MPNMYDIAYTEIPLFTKEECEKIIADFGGEGFEEGKVFSDSVVKKAARQSLIKFVAPSDESRWVFEKLGNAVASINSKTLQFDITGFEEGFQVSKYEVDGFYDWHVDIGAGDHAKRKLSVTVQLSAPEDYDGGDLMFFPTKFTAPRTQGTLAFFPSYMMHSVQPVKRGVRHSLVAWVAGPLFK